MEKAYRIKRFGIGGFRALKNVSLDMQDGRMIVLIGANGVGKTSVLDAFSILAASAGGSLNKKMSDMGGFASNLTYDGKTASMRFTVDLTISEKEPLHYDFQLEESARSYSIAKEELSHQRENFDQPFFHIRSSYDDRKYYDIEDKSLTRPNWEVDPYESSLSQVPKMFEQPESLRRILSQATLYHSLDVGSRAPVKLPQSLSPVDFPGKDGEDLLPFLYTLKESNSDRYEAIMDALHSAFPGFEGLNFPPAAAGMLTMTWKDENYTKPFFANQLSEGRLRFLWLVSLLQSPMLSSITMIDEPEVSLHPELLSLLVGLLREAAERTQIIIATHSDRLVRYLDPSEVVVMDQGENGLTTLGRPDENDLVEWMKEYSLDELWSMGRLGGRSRT